MFFPVHFFHRTDDEGPTERADPDDDRCNEKRPVEVACAIQKNSSKLWRDCTCEISDKVLYACPAAHHPRSSQGLGHCPNVASRRTHKRPRESEHPQKSGIRRDSRRCQKDSHAGVSESCQRFAHACRRSATANPSFLYLAEDGIRDREQDINKSTGLRHLNHRKMALANQIEGQPGHQEIRGVVKAKLADARSPGRPLPQDGEDSSALV